MPASDNSRRHTPPPTSWRSITIPSPSAQCTAAGYIGWLRRPHRTDARQRLLRAMATDGGPRGYRVRRRDATAGRERAAAIWTNERTSGLGPALFQATTRWLGGMSVS